MKDILAQLTEQLDQGRAVQQHNPDRAIRMPELLTIIPLSRTTICRMVKRGEFPAPIKLSPGGAAVCWRLSSVMMWLTEREVLSAPVDYTFH